MRRIIAAALATLLCVTAGAQIVNRLRVDQDTFLRYAYGRMQEFSSNNLPLADSLYNVGVEKDNFRYKCLGLSLEMPVRYARGEYERMDETVAEIKELLADRKDLREFYFSTLHEYCEFLVHIGRVSDAMLEARAMERLASAEKSRWERCTHTGLSALYRATGTIPTLQSRIWKRRCGSPARRAQNRIFPTCSSFWRRRT